MTPHSWCYSREQPPVTLLDDWIGVLALSTLWEFTRVSTVAHKLSTLIWANILVQIRKEAITALSPLLVEDTWQSIRLGRMYNVADWIRKSYVDLVKQDRLPLENLSQGNFPLDWSTIAKIFYLRDSLRPLSTESFFHSSCNRTHHRVSCSHGYSMPTFSTVINDRTARDAVDKMFQEELHD